MSNEQQTITLKGPKTFKINFDKIKTIEDMVKVLKALNIVFSFHVEDCPDNFKELYDNDFLIEIKL